MRARVILIAVVILACAAPIGSAASGGQTKATVYEPFSASGAVEMSGPTRSGYCWTSSETTPRRDAWRCAIKNLIYDPCFSSAKASGLVLCPTAPWNNSGIEINLTKPLPVSLGNRGALSIHNQPWALQLFTGRRCLFSGGASNELGGRRLNYFCTGAGKTGLWGYPDRKVQPWTIYIAPYTAKTLSTRATIRRAWM
jgi:hypothetical protein